MNKQEGTYRPVRLSAGLGAHLDITEKLRHLGFEKTDERRVHELKLVRDVEADDSLAVEILSKFLGEYVPMCLLHDKYDVGPLDEFCCNRDVCIMVRSGRRGLDVWIGGENLFGRGTSEAILAAYEEQSHHDWRLT